MGLHGRASDGFEWNLDMGIESCFISVPWWNRGLGLHEHIPNNKQSYAEMQRSPGMISTFFHARMCATLATQYQQVPVIKTCK